MKTAFQILLFFFAGAACAQDLNSVYIPEEWARECSVLNGVFQISDEEYCVYGRSGCDFGRAFWAVINSKREVVTYVAEGEVNSILEGYRHGDSLVFAGIWDASDVLPELFTLRLPYHIEGTRGRPTRINHVFMADNGLVFDPKTEKEWLVTQHRACIIEEGRADTIFRLGYGKEILSADAYDGVLYLTYLDTIWTIDSNGRASEVYNIPNIRSLRFDEYGGLYVLAVKRLYYVDSIGAVPKVIQIFNEVRGGPYSLSLGDDGRRGQRATLIFTSRQDENETEGTGVVFELGQPLDTINWIHPTFEIYQGVYLDNDILGVGIQRAFGSMYKSGIVLTNGDIVPPEIDLAIGMHIDTSYWRYDTTPRPSVVKTHMWDYTVTISNEGSDTVRFGDVFSPTAFSAWFFEFRQYCGFKEEIPPGDSIMMTCTAQAHLYDRVVGKQCMAVDAIDTYLDSDYSNNVSCAEIPRPIGVGTADVGTKEFAVYPNPGKGFITHELDLQDPHDLMVYDLNGRRVMVERGYGNQLDLSNLPSGVYTILISTTGQLYRSTLVITP